jgi:hypothetical protein
MYYVGLTGIGLIFTPNLILNLFGIAPTNEIWIRILGVLVFVLFILYPAIAKSRNEALIKATIYGRFFAATSIIVLAIIYGAPTLILFALVDLATAIWTYFELKKAI